MIKRLTILFLFLYAQKTIAQKVFTLADTIARYFDEVKAATAKNKSLWSEDLYGPILIVDPVSRRSYANQADTAGVLKKEGEIFSGKLPFNVPVANSSINWNGVKWAMILLPWIPKERDDRVNLVAHELFHRSQAKLGFILRDANNNHLGKKDGRIYLRLELEALTKAMETTDKKQRKKHLANALIFRKYRYILYPGADSTENLLELNEGIAEFTGNIIAGRSSEQAKLFFIRKIKEFISNASYVRTFAYRTTPVYGFVLKESKPKWYREINMKTNLGNYFIDQLKIKLPADIKTTALAIGNEYDLESIAREETKREEDTQQLIAEYRKKFIEQPHLEINFENKKASFDARNLTPLDDKGIVYPTITASDNWGVLTVDKVGALMAPDKNKITVTAPTKIDGVNVSGEGWELLLNEGYKIMKEEGGSYKLIKK